MKKSTCYALFIGVNTYDSPQIPHLKGCIRDAESLLTYIQSNLNENKFELQVETLFTGTDSPPTRHNIIDKISTHLAKAKAQHGDKALLFYAGHGSKEKAHPNFKEADGNLQTLVPCDARIDINGTKVKNILDKEIRFLFQHLWKYDNQKPDLIFIQDSCHSTGASRKDEQLAFVTEKLFAIETTLAKENNTEVKITKPIARFTEPTDYEKSGRDWEILSSKDLVKAYSAFKIDKDLLTKIVTNLKAGNMSFDEDIPLIEHIHFAACGKNEFAYELPGVGGVFTSRLLKILKASQNTISYHDLFNRIRMNIAGVYEQTPDLFVNHSNFNKRHETFLGGLLKHGELTPYQDVDIFKGFSPVFYQNRKGWQLKAGEMELLPNLRGRIKAIPIEVFPQGQKPVGKPNAEINFVAANFSKVKFTTATFDKETDANKLYAMIPPQYMRRWRVEVMVETKTTNNNFETLFSNHLFRNRATIAGQKEKAFVLVATTGSSDFLIKEIDNWYHLCQKDGTLIFQCAAARYTQKEGGCGVLQKPNDNILYKVKREQESVMTEDYELISPNNESIAILLAHLTKVFNSVNPKSAINVFFEQAAGENAFVKFQKEEKTTIAYYSPFIKWVEDKSEAKYTIRTESDGFGVFPIVNGQIAENPAFRKTGGLKTRDGYKIILSLQKMCKWQTVLNLNNSLQLKTLAAHKFEFKFKLYTAIAKNKTDKRSYTSANIESWNETHYKKNKKGESLIYRGEVKLLNDLQKEQTEDKKKPICFLNHPEHESTIELTYDLDIVHLQGNQHVYISTLLLDSNFAVLPLQLEMGNNLLPPKICNDSSKGTLSLHGLTIPKSNQMRDALLAIKKETFYIKVFIAYSRFDISGLLQGGLPAAVKNTLNKIDGKSEKRVEKPPKPEDTGAWMAFTIPIAIE